MATGQRSPTAFWNQCLTSSVVSALAMCIGATSTHTHACKINLCKAAKICFIPGQNML